MGLLPWNRQIAAWAICYEVGKSQDGPPPMKSSNHSMGQLPWNCQIAARAIWREIIKLQHGPSAMKSWNHRMNRLPWNCQITAWANCHENVKLQHGHLPWNRQITAWIIWREIIKLQHGLDLENILGDVLLVIRAKILFVWIKDIFSMMCFWWVAPQYSLFGFRIYSPWCALDKSRQKITSLALEYILPDVFMVSRANVIIGGNWKIPSEMCSWWVARKYYLSSHLTSK